MASNRGQGAFVWQLSPEMAAHARVEFAALAQDGFVPGDKVRTMLASRNLAQEDLAAVWALADRDKDGKLNEAEFALLRFLVYARQAAQPLPVMLPDALLASVGLRDTAPSSTAAMTTPTTGTKDVKEGGKPDSKGSGNSDAYATLSPASYATYAASFAALQQRGVVSGAAAQPVLQQSGLPVNELAAVWALADQDKDGALNEAEFVCALHLAATRLATKDPLPSSLPAALAQTIAHLAQAYAQAQQQGANQLALTTTAPGQVPGAPAVNVGVGAVPPLPDLAIDASVFELPPRTPLPPLPSAAPSPLDDEALVVQYGVSDAFVPLYTAAGDIARLASEVLDAETGLRVLQQSEPELQQLLYTLERQEQLLTQLAQRHEQLNAEQRTLEAATAQLQGLANSLEQTAQQHDAELQRAKEELRALVAEVTRAHETLSTGAGVQEALATLRAQQQQLSAEHAAQQQLMEQIVPEGQRLIAQLQQLTAPVVAMQQPPPAAMLALMQQQQQHQQQQAGGEDESSEESEESEDSGVVARSKSGQTKSAGGASTASKKGGDAKQKKKSGFFGKRK